jgi:tRNA (guanine-N(7)-)-methyltransferase
MKLNGVWLDLHASDFEDNVMTEYEQKFANKGQVIYRVEAAF